MRSIDVIGMPMKYGCFVEGADLAFSSMKDSYKKILNPKNIYEIDTNLGLEEHKKDKHIKYLEQVMEANNRLYNQVSESLNASIFPIIVGGDHSSAIGSIKASLDYTEGDLSVIWIDAHTDIHTEKTTPSGNIHGMPLSVCLGRCDERFNIGKYNLKPENLYYIGVRSYEIEEISYVQESKITCYMDFEVTMRKIENIVKEIIKNIKTKYVHISFDLDCISDKEFSAVNVSVENKYIDGTGLSLKMIKTALSMLLTNLNVCSLDIVEYNPLLDTDLKCKEKYEEILEVIKEAI